MRMTNEIGRVRREIEGAFAGAWVWPGERLVEDSPCGRYRLGVDSYAAAESPGYASAVVRRADTGEVVATVRCNDTHVFHGWVTREGRDDLICPPGNDATFERRVAADAFRVPGAATSAPGSSGSPGS